MSTETFTQIVETTLTDGSVVHDVLISDPIEGGKVRLAARDEEHAIELCEFLRDYECVWLAERIRESH